MRPKEWNDGKDTVGRHEGHAERKGSGVPSQDCHITPENAEEVIAASRDLMESPEFKALMKMPIVQQVMNMASTINFDEL